MNQHWIFRHLKNIIMVPAECGQVYTLNVLNSYFWCSYKKSRVLTAYIIDSHPIIVVLVVIEKINVFHLTLSFQPTLLFIFHFLSFILCDNEFGTSRFYYIIMMTVSSLLHVWKFFDLIFLVIFIRIILFIRTWLLAFFYIIQLCIWT